jgi:hypothetical protein
MHISSIDKTKSALQLSKRIILAMADPRVRQMKIKTGVVKR